MTWWSNVKHDDYCKNFFSFVTAKKGCYVKAFVHAFHSPEKGRTFFNISRAFTPESKTW